MTIRVLIVDDHAVVRSGIRRVLDAASDLVRPPWTTQKKIVAAGLPEYLAERLEKGR